MKEKTKAFDKERKSECGKYCNGDGEYWGRAINNKSLS